MRRWAVMAMAGVLLASCSAGRERGEAPAPTTSVSVGDPPTTAATVGDTQPIVGLPVLALVIPLEPERSAEKAVPFPAVRVDAEVPRYQADTTVLQASSGPAWLCLGIILDSLPPLCGNVPVPNWSWDYVEGELSMSGTTWGGYHVVGTFDGERFTLTEAPGPRGPAAAPVVPDFGSACPTPPGGWTSRGPGPTSDEALRSAVGLAHQSEAVAGVWLDNGPPGGPVLNAAFTESLARHETELRAVWGGPLCVSVGEHPLALLRSYQDALFHDRIPGLQPLSGFVDEPRAQVVLDVVLLTDQLRQALDAAFGPGVVRVSSALRVVA